MELVVQTDQHGFGLLKQETPRHANSLNCRSQMKKTAADGNLRKLNKSLKDHRMFTLSSAPMLTAVQTATRKLSTIDTGKKNP